MHEHVNLMSILVIVYKNHSCVTALAPLNSDHYVYVSNQILLMSF